MGSGIYINSRGFQKSNQPALYIAYISPRELIFLFRGVSMNLCSQKIFNSRVKCVFNKEVAHISAPDEDILNNLLRFAQFHFYLAELYTRKFRKEIYENKGAFSSIEFFQPIYQDINKKFSNHYSEFGKVTNFGIKEDELKKHP